MALDCGFRLTAIVTRQSEEEMRLREGEQVTAVVKATSIRIVPRRKTWDVNNGGNAEGREDCPT